MNDHSDPKDATLAVWAGEDSPHWENATQVPVVYSVSFGYADLEHWAKVGRGEIDGHIYSRNTNPTVRAFEEKIRRLERAQQRAAMGIPENLVRYSVGIEDANDLIEDLKQALDSIASDESA